MICITKFIFFIFFIYLLDIYRVKKKIQVQHKWDAKSILMRSLPYVQIPMMPLWGERREPERYPGYLSST